MKKIYIPLLLITTFFIVKCVEPINVLNSTFEKHLVVEAQLTNEMKHHTVKLSNTFALDKAVPDSEKNATVVIKDDAQNTYAFTEVTDGTYRSVNPFKAELNRSYTLEITTTDGRSFASTKQKITGVNTINDVVAKHKVKANSLEGVSINVISNSSDENAKYYRYSFIETFKVVAPKWNEENLVIVSAVRPFRVTKVRKKIPDFNLICYRTETSNKIILANTSNLSQNNVNSEVHFLERKDYKIGHRYSMLVRQYVQSIDAHNYFKTLQKFSSNGSLFTQSQPGFLTGNIASTANKNDKVIGFFEVTSVSEKRVFFNHSDFFPTPSGAYPDKCLEVAPPFRDPFDPDFSPLIDLLQTGQFMFYKDNTRPTEALPGPYILVKNICGDCTELGTKVKPSFWID